MDWITNSIGYESDTALSDSVDEDILYVAEAWEIATTKADRSISIVDRTVITNEKGMRKVQPTEADLLTVIVPEIDLILAGNLNMLILEQRLAAIQVISFKRIPKSLPYIPLSAHKEGMFLFPNANGKTTRDFIQYATVDEARGKYDELVAGLLEKI